MNTPFTQHCAVVNVPRLVTTDPVHVNRSLLSGNREQIDAYADEMLRLERLREADAASEVLTEGRTWPQQANPHDD